MKVTTPYDENRVFSAAGKMIFRTAEGESKRFFTIRTLTIDLSDVGPRLKFGKE